VGVVVLVALGSAGCSSSGSSSGTGAGAGTKATTTAAKAPEGDGSVDAAAAPISAEALCAHLKKDLPRIKAVGSQVGAEAQLTLSIADLYNDHLDQLDGDVVDAQAKQSCPDTRAELLEAAGVDSFGSL
jgi:hypothetical protein